MAIASGRYDRFVGRVDFLWAKIASGNRTGPYGSGGLIEQTVIDAKVGYRALEHPMAPPLRNPPGAEQALTVDLLAGFRWWHLDVDADVRPPGAAGAIPYLSLPLQSVSSWWDPILGVRVVVPVMPDVSVGVVGDIGGFGIGAASDFTWGVIGAVSWHLSDSWSLSLAGRAVEVKRHGDVLTYYGPAAGSSYRL